MGRLRKVEGGFTFSLLCPYFSLSILNNKIFSSAQKNQIISLSPNPPPPPPPKKNPDKTQLSKTTARVKATKS